MNPRCPTCGSVPRGHWHRARILETVKEWAATHGGPPTQREWHHAKPWHPSTGHVRIVFGTWNAMIVAAGLTPRPRGGRAPVWTRDGAIGALYQWMFDNDGRMPNNRDWQKSDPGRPSKQQILGLFGSWNAFIVVAGYEPSKSFRTREGYSAQSGSRMRRLEGRPLARGL